MIGEGDTLAGRERHAFFFEQAALDGCADRIEDVELGGGRGALADDALPGKAEGWWAGAHGGADDTGGAGAPGELGDLTVGGHLAPGNLAHDSIDVAIERGDVLGFAGLRRLFALCRFPCGRHLLGHATTKAMQIQVRYFAVFRERLGLDAETIDVPEGTSVAGALELLGARHETIARLRGRFQVAVNQAMVPVETKLADGDELVLIPPVAGGIDGRHIRVLEEPLSADRCVAAVTNPDMGGITTFLGVVRRHNQGRDVDHLEYEAYVEMAEKTMRDIADQIEAEVPGCRLAVEHRVGLLQVGDTAVVIAAAAPHRAEAFTACRAMIDRLKERVPIWKKEVGPDGSEWIGLGP